jgi:hypothetical protein
VCPTHPLISLTAAEHYTDRPSVFPFYTFSPKSIFTHTSLLITPQTTLQTTLASFRPQHRNLHPKCLVTSAPA